MTHRLSLLKAIARMQAAPKANKYISVSSYLTGVHPGFNRNQTLYYYNQLSCAEKSNCIGIYLPSNPESQVYLDHPPWLTHMLRHNITPAWNGSNAWEDSGLHYESLPRRGAETESLVGRSPCEASVCSQRAPTSHQHTRGMNETWNSWEMDHRCPSLSLSLSASLLFLTLTSFHVLYSVATESD